MLVIADEEYLQATPIIPPSKLVEEILNNAGLHRAWIDPSRGRIFEVERMPVNKILFGLLWKEVPEFRVFKE